MNCTQAEVLIQTGLDGRLSPPERTRLDAHLAHCAACRAAWDEYRRLGRTATDWVRRPLAPPDPGDTFTAQVMARIAAGQASSPPPTRFWQVLLSTLMTLLTLAALSFWAGPLLPHSLPSFSLTSLLSPHAVFSTEDFWRALRRVPQDTLDAWDTLTSQTVSPSWWVWSALALTLGVNAAFAWRARHQPREAAAR